MNLTYEEALANPQRYRVLGTKGYYVIEDKLWEV